jgi:hypothetical protein
VAVRACDAPFPAREDHTHSRSRTALTPWGERLRPGMRRRAQAHHAAQSVEGAQGALRIGAGGVGAVRARGGVDAGAGRG